MTPGSLVKGPRQSPLPGSPGREEGKEERADSVSEPSWLRCRTCGAEIASERDLVSIRGLGSQLFVNPHGIVFEIVTLRHAQNLLALGGSTTEFTWFAGYAWQIVVCARCQTHLGWVYDAISEAMPPRFYGLIREALESP